MFRILIVDDEEIILTGVKLLIEKRLKLSFPVTISVASSAMAALKMLSDFNPNLILTDIRMPLTDGFAFIEQLRSRNMECDIIILTSHADFAYAKKAISFQIQGFLLKPIDKDELEAAIKQSFEKSAEKRKDEEDECLLQLRNLLLYDLPIKQDFVNEEILLQVFPYRYYTIILVENEQNRHDYTRLLESEISFYFPVCRTFYFSSKKHYITICNHDTFYTDTSPLKLNLKNLFLRDTFYYSESISCNSCLELHSLYVNAQLRILHEKIYADNRTLADISFITYRDCIDIFTEQDPQKIETALADYLDRILAQYPLSPGLFCEIAYSFVRNCNIYLENLGAKPMSHSFKSTNMGSKEDLIHVIQHAIQLYREQQKLSDSGRNEPSSIARIAAYISCHYTEDISLESLAEDLELHPNYICALFKKHFGESYLTYLQKVRVNAAKELLASSRSYTLQEVAEKVGCQNVNRLIRVFKKYEGITPGDYKKMHA